MDNWTNKQWGVVIGVLVVFAILEVNFGGAALIVLGGVVGYLVGKYLDRDFDLEDIRDRSQRRSGTR